MKVSSRVTGYTSAALLYTGGLLVFSIMEYLCPDECRVVPYSSMEKRTSAAGNWTPATTNVVLRRHTSTGTSTIIPSEKYRTIS